LFVFRIRQERASINLAASREPGLFAPLAAALVDPGDFSNVARMGKFSSDRTVLGYAPDIRGVRAA
jgi:hypothetical protein